MISPLFQGPSSPARCHLRHPGEDPQELPRIQISAMTFEPGGEELCGFFGAFGFNSYRMECDM